MSTAPANAGSQPSPPDSAASRFSQAPVPPSSPVASLLSSIPTASPTAHLRPFTAARIGLGRVGGSLPTREVLSFSYDHALARDAVHAPFDSARLSASLHSLGIAMLSLESAAPDRATYLRRPDLGRRLSPASAAQLSSLSLATAPVPDLVIIVSDGLSALAAELQAPPFLAALLPLLSAADWRLAPICLVRHARVGLLDEIGTAFRARLALILLGERPGLGTPDSLGAYFEYNPRPGLTNADRNCVSNIRPAGLPPTVAATRLFGLLSAALQVQSSGIALKEDAATLPANPNALA